MHVIGTAGHVDHGKSALVTRLTGIDPDRFEEEKRRGLTIDLGFAWFVLPSGTEVGIVDVPGHERFISNMLAGAGGITLCLFVVAANEGWMQQSAEHLTALEALAVDRGMIALTKSDLVDEETLELAEMEVREHLAGSSLSDAPIVAVSSETKEGLDELVTTLDDLVASSPGAPDRHRPRLWIDRSFSIKGAGTVVTGTSAGGSFDNGDEVEVLPGGGRARIRNIQTHRHDVEQIGPGNRVALNLSGLQRSDVGRGQAVVRPSQWLESDELDVWLSIPPRSITGHGEPLREKGAHLLHAGTAETAVRIRLLGLDQIASGQAAPARIYLQHPLPLIRGDHFVLRDAGRVLTIGGGRVLDPRPSRLKRTENHERFLQQYAELDSAAALALLVDMEGALPADLAAIRSGSSAATGIDDPLPRNVSRCGALLVSRAWIAESLERIEGAVERYHGEHPLERGMGREELRALSGLDPATFDALLTRSTALQEAGAMVTFGGHRVIFDREQEMAADRLIKTLDEAGFSPPLRNELQIDDALLRSLATRGDIVQVDSFFLTAARAGEARAMVREAIADTGPLSVAQIRDVLQTSRKYAVPICEWLDATGATRRVGDLRGLGPRP